MKEFATQHPWMTFILGLMAISAIREIVVSRAPTAPQPLIPMKRS